MKKKLTTLQKQKLEAIIRNDAENRPYKYRDIHAELFYGITPYKDMEAEEINDMFKDYELEITSEDEEWAEFNK